MFPRTFRTLRKFLAPRWLTEGEGGLVGYALDLVKDAFLQRLYQGHLARFPQNGPNGETAPTDALTAMGRDRRVIRGIFETDAQYALRLITWLDERKTTGNPFTLMRQLHAYTGTANGVSFRTVDVNGNWYSRSATGVETSSVDLGNWNWDGDTAQWSRFWVIIYPGTLWVAESTWGSGVWGDTTGTLGSTATPEHAASLRAIVADWKPAGTTGEIILALDPVSFSPAAPEPDGTWGKWYVYSGTDAVPSRLATARYSGA
jgi:hypothetical protein